MPSTKSRKRDSFEKWDEDLVPMDRVSATAIKIEDHNRSFIKKFNEIIKSMWPELIHDYNQSLKRENERRELTKDNSGLVIPVENLNWTSTKIGEWFKEWIYTGYHPLCPLPHETKVQRNKKGQVITDYSDTTWEMLHYVLN